MFAHQVEHCILPSAYAVKWYITLFTNSFPFATQLRLWDALLLEGLDVLIIIAVAIIWHFRRASSLAAPPRSLSRSDFDLACCRRLYGSLGVVRVDRLKPLGLLPRRVGRRAPPLDPQDASHQGSARQDEKLARRVAARQAAIESSSLLAHLIPSQLAFFRSLPPVVLSCFYSIASLYDRHARFAIASSAGICARALGEEREEVVRGREKKCLYTGRCGCGEQQRVHVLRD